MLINRKSIISICCILFIACHEVAEPCGADKTDFLLSIDRLVDDASFEAQCDDPDFVALDHQMHQLKEKCFSKWEDQLTLKEQLHMGRQLISFEYYKLSAQKHRKLLN